MEKREHQNFHVGLKAFIADGDKLLILQDEIGFWELPGGRAEKSEIQKELREILTREVAEELGEEIQYEIGPLFHAWIRKPDLSQEGVPEVYRTNDFCIFLVGFSCAYKAGEIRLSPEHRAFQWVTKAESENLEFENTYGEAVRKYFQSF